MATIAPACEPKSEAPAKAALSPSPSFIAVAILCLAAQAPLLVMHVQQLWVRPHYQFFPLVLVGAAVLLWTRRSAWQRVEPGSGAVTIGLTAFAWVLLAGAVLLNSSWLAAVTSLVSALTVLQILGLVRRLFVVWLYLWLVIPPPFGLDNSLIMSLQTLTTRWSSSLLDLVRIQHVIAGHTMEVGGQRLFVEEACAGINSLFSILACTLFYVLLMRIRPVRAAALLLASLAWVLVANVARVFLIAYLSKRWDLHLAEGWRHDALGFLLFAMALGLIWSTHRLILFFTPFSRPEGEHSPGPPETAAADRGTLTAALNQSWLSSWMVGGAFGLLLAAHFLVYGVPRPAFAWSPGPTAAGVLRLTEDSLAPDLAGWRREKMTDETRSLGNAFGQFSKTWTYSGESHRGVVSLDYPFAAWHELSECYYGQGWDLEAITNHTASEPIQPAHYCAQKMKKSGLRWGYLLYCQIDSTGQVLAPPRRGSATGTIYRQESALHRLITWDNAKPDVVQRAGSVYQCQFFVASFAPLTPSEQEKMKTRFFQAYNELHRQVFESRATSHLLP